MSIEDQIWDGNGGTLDPKTASQRDLIVALHVTLNRVVVPKLNDLDTRMRKQEDGELTRGQKSAVRWMLQADKDAAVSRRSARTPVWSVVIAALALMCATIAVVASIKGWTG